jgi:hypothetical protein
MKFSTLMALAGASLSMAACSPEAAEGDDGSWMRLDGERHALAEARCGEIFDGDEYIMQSDGENFLKVRFQKWAGEDAVDFNRGWRIEVTRDAWGGAYYMLDRNQPLEIQGDRTGASGQGRLYSENDDARERHPDGLDLEFSIRCAQSD